MRFDEQTDFLIVGSGAGSMCAGLYMRDHGHSVVLLEKSDLLGGVTCKSGGVMWIPNNRFMRRDGIHESAELAQSYLDSLAEGQQDVPGSTPQKRAAYLKQAPEMLDYLVEQHNMPFDRVPYWPDYYDDRPGGCSTSRTVVAELFDLKELGSWRKKIRPGFLPLPLMLADAMNLSAVKHEWAARWMLVKFIGRLISQIFTGKRKVPAGAALQARALKVALDKGVDVRTGTPVTALIMDDDQVVGVETVKDGQPWRIGASCGVLVNAGGFAKNAAMRAEYQPETSIEWSNATDEDTGDLIQEMRAKGAALYNMDMMVGYQSTIPPGKEGAYIKPGAQRMLCSPHAIMVDQSGVRYQNEGGSYVAFCRGMLDRHALLPSVPSWGILDARSVRKYGIAGAKSRRQLNKWQQAGYLKVSNSIAGLAQEIGCDPAVLTATVERFNGFVRNGNDEDFGRGNRQYDLWLGDRFNQDGPSETLGTLEQGPFYAVPIVPGDVGTYGGVVTDEYARVLRDDGSVIGGLYATGVCTASVFGRVYPGAGASIGPAYTFGYIAAKHAVQQAATA